MSTKTERKRRRQQQRAQETGRGTRIARRIPFKRIGIAVAAVGAIVLAIVVINRIEGRNAAKIIDQPADAPAAGLTTGISVGHLAPNFEGTSLDGTKTRLSDLRGKVVMVNFYASWCVGCRAEIPGLQNVYDRYRDKGFEILGVNDGESKSTARNFLRGLGAEYPAVLDPTHVVSDEYRVGGLPVSVIVDRQGVVRRYVPGELQQSDADALVTSVLANEAAVPAPAVAATPQAR